MLRISKIVGYLLLIFTLFVLVWINIKIHNGPNLVNPHETKQDVILQLNYLNNQLKQKDVGKEMQKLYPEGFIFINTLYGLAWSEVARDENQESILFNHALKEARFAYDEVNSDYARHNFDRDLKPEYGIFYRGWKNYLLGKIIEIQFEKDSSVVKEFISNCDDIANAISNSMIPFPESYWKSSWPADAVVAIASLKLHDEIFGSKYDTVVNDWLLRVKSKLDPETKLIPHSTYFDSGDELEGTRGSSICLMLIFLADINQEFAEQEFKLFQNEYAITRFGLPAIREFPHGRKGKGDVDSGPVIFDISFSGTIVSIGTFKKFGEYKTADKISDCIEGFGFPIKNGKEKKYMFGKLPIADAFIAWSRIQNSNKKIIQDYGNNNYDLGSMIPFHFITSLILLVILLILWRKKIIRFFR